MQLRFATGERDRAKMPAIRDDRQVVDRGRQAVHEQLQAFRMRGCALHACKNPRRRLEVPGVGSSDLGKGRSMSSTENSKSHATGRDAVEQVKDATGRVVDTVAEQAKAASEKVAETLAASGKEIASTVIDAVAGRTKDLSGQAIDKVADATQTMSAKAQGAMGSAADK